MFLSHTQFENWRKCRRYWDWNRMYESPTTNKDFWMGDVVHQWLYARNKGNADLDAIIRKESNRLEDQELLNECADLVRGMLEHYTMWADETDLMQQLKVVGAEQEVRVPLGEHTLVGRIDQFIQFGKKKKELYVHEFKTASSIQPEWLTMSEQASIYVYLAQQAFPKLNIKGVVFTVLAKQIPVMPQVRNGSVWYAGNVRGSIFYAEKLAREQNVELPNELRARLTAESRGQGYFHRQIVTRTTSQIELVVKRMHTMAAEMQAAAIYPSFSQMNCPRCPFNAPCMAYERGDNYAALLDTLYQKKKGGESRASESQDSSSQPTSPSKANRKRG